MAVSVNRSDMRTGARRLADVEAFTDRFPDAELNDYVNRGLGSYHQILVQANGEKYKASYTDISVTSGTTLYNLPATFFKIFDVHATINGHNEWFLPYTHDERASLLDTAGGHGSYPYCYGLIGSQIEFLPTPGAAITVRLWYVPDTAQLTDDVTAFDSLNRLGDEYVMAYAAQLCALKDAKWERYNALGNKLAMIEKQIRATVPNRDRNAPPMIVDVRGGHWMSRVAQWRFR